jgi:endo-1,4-beta-D-glucanase Y
VFLSVLTLMRKFLPLFAVLCLAVLLLGIWIWQRAKLRPAPYAKNRPDAVWLQSAWEQYKALYLNPDGYARDITRADGEVTSESQSYALLRAVWMDDPTTFAKVFEWTEAHLRRPQDGLYAWHWDTRRQTVVDANTATDGDQDIAFALILASHQFKHPPYLNRARDLVLAIRKQTGISVRDGWFPSAGNWAVRERIVNLSYFVPYAYPYFARLDPEGQWERVIEVGYDLLGESLRPPARLPPDFMGVDEEGHVLPLLPTSALSRDFSFDAIRIYWRVAVDCQIHRRLRACADPARTGELVGLLARDGRLYQRYSLTGEILDRGESASFYGALLPAFALWDPPTAEAILDRHLQMGQLDRIATNPKRYYDVNWTWFGLAAWSSLIRERTPSPEVVFDGTQIPPAGSF